MWWWKKREEDLERELRSHIESEAEERQDYYAARRAFGNMTSVKEEVREMWGINTWERIQQDMRHALRTLRKSPAFPVAAVATLALGIGANTAMFSVVDAILLKPLPFPDPGRLIRISGDVVRQQASLVMLRDGSRTTDYAAYSGNTEFNLTGDGEPRRVVGSVVTANLFSTFGQRPLL